MTVKSIEDIKAFVEICKGKIIEVFYLHERSWKKGKEEFVLDSINGLYSMDDTIMVSDPNEIKLTLDYVEEAEFGHNKETTALVFTRHGHHFDTMLHVKR